MSLNNTKVTKKVCLFGTSADPPTGNTGHAGIVKYLSSLTQLFDEIWVLPVYQHMYKSKRNRLSSFEHRMNMCQLAFKDDDNDNVKAKVFVYDYEKVCYESKCDSSTNGDNNNNIPVRVGTADLLEWLLYERFKHEQIEFTLVLGADSFLDLSNFKWNRSIDIIQLVEGRIIVINRKEQLKTTTANNVNNNDNTKVLTSTVEQMNIKFKAKMQVLTIDCLSDVSSTLVRNTNDADALLKYVSTSVLNYMQENKLYTFDSS